MLVRQYAKSVNKLIEEESKMSQDGKLFEGGLKLIRELLYKSKARSFKRKGEKLHL
jgi:hypothetical protein